MKIIVCMDARGEIMAWGYRLLVHTYPTAQIAAGYGIEPHEIGELFLEC